MLSWRCSGAFAVHSARRRSHRTAFTFWLQAKTTCLYCTPNRGWTHDSVCSSDRSETVHGPHRPKAPRMEPLGHGDRARHWSDVLDRSGMLVPGPDDV